MAETMKFDLVSPEQRLLSGEASAVRIPGAEGDLTAMPNHAPTITTLRPGILTVEMAGGDKEFAVTGGFAEITSDGTTVLAEAAYARGADSRAAIEAHLDEARARHAEAPAEHKDAAEKFVADLAQLAENMA